MKWCRILYTTRILNSIHAYLHNIQTCKYTDKHTWCWVDLQWTKQCFTEASQNAYITIFGILSTTKKLSSPFFVLRILVIYLRFQFDNIDEYNSIPLHSNQSSKTQWYKSLALLVYISEINFRIFSLVMTFVYMMMKPTATMAYNVIMVHFMWLKSRSSSKFLKCSIKNRKDESVKFSVLFLKNFQFFNTSTSNQSGFFISFSKLIRWGLILVK